MTKKDRLLARLALLNAALKVAAEKRQEMQVAAIHTEINNINWYISQIKG